MPKKFFLLGFAESFAALLPDFRTVPGQPKEYWNQLEIRTDDLVENLQDVETICERLKSTSIGPDMIQAICLWIGCPCPQEDAVAFLGRQLAENTTAKWGKDLFCLMRLVYNRRYDAIETICRSLLPENIFDLIFKSSIDAPSKRLAYAMQVYYRNPDQLQLLLLFEKVEMIGYNRHRLVECDSDGKSHRHISKGISTQELNKEIVTQTLEAFEENHKSKRRSTCLDIHHENDTALIFILREFRENSIREVDQTVFGDEAELIVLKISDQMCLLEEHSEQEIGLKIAQSMAMHFFKNKNIAYKREDTLTREEDLQKLIMVLQTGGDHSVCLHEIHMEYAPLQDSPTLILRAHPKGMGKELSGVLKFLTEKNIKPLEDIKKLRSLGLRFTSPLSDSDRQSNIFKLQFEEHKPHQYLVHYYLPGAGVSIETRQAFERYLKQNYHVTVVPKNKYDPKTR